MALRITQEGNSIVLSGNLNSNTTTSLENHLNHLLESENHLNVNLSGLDRMDMNGVSCINKIKHEAHIAYKSVKVNGRRSINTTANRTTFLTVA